MAADVSADLRWVLDKLPDGVLFLDREWRITYANEQGRKVIRLHPEHLNGPSHWELFPAAVGTEQEQAAATLGSGSWQTFWRITLPSIRWGLTYGLVPTTARTLGEFGAVIMVSSNLPGESQTLTLLVNDRYNRGAESGAYALSTLMMGVALTFLIVKAILLVRRKRAKAQA